MIERLGNSGNDKNKENKKRLIAKCKCVQCGAFFFDLIFNAPEEEYNEYMQILSEGDPLYFVPAYENACVLCGEKTTAFKINKIIKSAEG